MEILQRIVELEPSEKRKLLKVTVGYGKLKPIAQRMGLHENTVRNVRDKGRGEPETIEKIRNYLIAS